MAESLSRELILPAKRLAVPTKPSERQLAALAEQSIGEWAVSPRDWTTRQVVRLAVAAVLAAQAGRTPEADLDTLTLGQVAQSFRPHVGLAAQAFRLGVVEAVNAGVPAAADPLRETLKRMGVTGREPLVMLALGLDRVPTHEASSKEFWSTVRTSTTLTAVVDAVASGGHRAGDMSKLDRRQLARADALVLAAGKVTAVSLGNPPASGGSWLPVPVALTRPRRRAHEEQGRKGGTTEITLRADGWTEVFEIALDALGAAMHQLDTGQRPRGRSSTTVDALAHRLVAARKRTVSDVVSSLRDIDPFVLEMFDHDVEMADVRVAVPVLEDDALAALWLSPEALAAPLVTGAADLFFGGSEPRPQEARRGRPERGERRGGGERPGPQAGGPRGGRGALPEGGAPAGGGRGGRRRGGRGQQSESSQSGPPQAESPQAESPQTESPQAESPRTESPQAESPQTESPQSGAPQTESATT